MPDIKADQIILFAAFLFPGFLSIAVYRLRVPSKEFYFKDQVLEAFSFSLVNFAISVWPIYQLGVLSELRNQWVWEWLAVVVGLVVIPTGLGWSAATLRNWAGRRGFIPASSKTAFDWAFSEQRGCWLKIRLNDGSWVGGKFDSATRSFASAYPEAGHLYIGESWSLDSEGNFMQQMKDKPGLVLKPTEYRYLLLYKGDDK